MAFLSIIRRWHKRDHVPIREISRRTGVSRNTIRKYLRSDVTEPKFRVPDRPSKLDPYAEKLSAWLRREARLQPRPTPIDAPDGLRRAALQRPPSWADPGARPSPGCFCSCCLGRRWWGDPCGWRCWACHPPDHLPPDAVKEVRT